MKRPKENEESSYDTRLGEEGNVILRLCPFPPELVQLICHFCVWFPEIYLKLAKHGYIQRISARDCALWYLSNLILGYLKTPETSETLPGFSWSQKSPFYWFQYVTFKRKQSIFEQRLETYLKAFVRKHTDSPKHALDVIWGKKHWPCAPVGESCSTCGVTCKEFEGALIRPCKHQLCLTCSLQLLRKRATHCQRCRGKIQGIVSLVNPPIPWSWIEKWATSGEVAFAQTCLE